MTDPIHLPKLISDELKCSRSEARRLIATGGVKIDGVACGAADLPADSLAGKILTVGKRRSVKL